MHLIRLKPYYFRAFGDNQPISFSSLTIFFGGNATGKSSLAEAIEWLFYGTTKRRQKGNLYSKNEYKGCFVNKGCPQGTAPYVEAEIEIENGTRHIFRRTINLDRKGYPIDDETNLSIDGEKVDGLLEAGICYSEAHCPVIVQHGIQDLIHTKPIDRYRHISGALGLSDLIAFKDVLEKAKNSYRTNNLPIKIVDANSIMRSKKNDLGQIGLPHIVTRLDRGEILEKEDFEAIKGKAKELTKSKATSVDELIRDVNVCYIEEKNKIFDIQPFCLNRNIDQFLHHIDEKINGIKKINEHVIAKMSSYVISTVPQYSEIQINFWKSGIELLKNDQGIFANMFQSIECPFCSEKTVTEATFEKIHNCIDSNKKVSTYHEDLYKTFDLYIQIFIELDDLLSQISFEILNNQHINILKGLLENNNILEGFIFQNQSCYNSIILLKSKISFIINSIPSPKVGVNPEKMSELANTFRDYLQQIEVLWRNIKNSLDQYAIILTDIYSILEYKLANEKNVSVFPKLSDLLTIKPQIDLVVLARQYEADILECQRIADEYILTQQKMILNTREREILDWYERLSPNQDVRFSGLEPGRNEINLKAIAFKKELNAASDLSQSQLNCLGLSIHIPSIVSLNSPFKFIVFDDPVQAMDDDHHDAFLMNVIPELLEQYRLQVIVLTHLQYTADRIRNLNFDRNPKYYKFDKLSSDGPSIKEHIPLLGDLKRIRDYSIQDEESRKFATDRIRVMCEAIMREAHIKLARSEMPTNCINCTAMLKEFRMLSGVKPNHIQHMKDTIDWSDPSHHTDPNYQTSNSGSINLYINRLCDIINELGLDTQPKK